MVTLLHAVETNELGRAFGSTVAVDALTLSVEPGEIFGFLGPNGAGKTTTIRMLATLIRPTGGSATVLGHSVVGDPLAIRHQLGVMTERPGLYERLSVDANLRLWAEAHEVDDADRAIAEALEFVGLAGRRESRVAALSKGLKQRAALARAVVHRPKLLLLDEPSSGLDPAASVQVEAMLQELARRGATVFINTHRLAEAQRLCDRVAILNTRLIAEGSPASLRERFLGNRLTIELDAPPSAEIERAMAATGARGIVVRGTNVDCAVDDVRASTPELVAALVHAGAGVLGVAPSGDLEAVYLDLVGETAGPGVSAIRVAA